MENDYWPSIWQALYDNGASAKKEEGTHRYWLTLSPAQQEHAFTTITKRLQAGKFVWFDPIRAIKEALRTLKPSTPEFLSGRQQEQNWRNGIPMVQVKYNGSFRICTRATMEQFHLDYQQDWLPLKD